MESLASAFWGVMTATGGAFALTFIVAIFLGIAALTLLFLGSAAVALEQFARVSSSWRNLAKVVLCWSGVVGAAYLYRFQPELAAQPWTEWLRNWVVASGLAILVVTAASLLVRSVLKAVLPRHLATGNIVVLGIGYSLVVGGSDSFTYSATAVSMAAGIAGLVALRRRRRVDLERSAPGEGERLLRVLCGALVPGVAITLALSEPNFEVATGGAAILQLYIAGILLALLPLAAAGLLDSRGTSEWFIAIRYLMAKRRQTFISVITGICVVGIATGVWLIITVLSVMNGFERTWREEIIGNRAHFTVHHNLGPFEDYEAILDRVTSMPGVVSASPYLDAEAMVRAAGGRIMAVRVRGVDPARVGDVTDLREDLLSGSLADLEPGATAEGEDPAILIGNQLASSVGARVGDLLLMISPFGGPQTPLGPAPRLERFRVVGIFQSTFFQFDEVFTFVNLTAAQAFKRTGDVIDGIEARTTDFYRSRSVAAEVQHELGYPFFTRDWNDFFPAFFQALKTERVMMFVLLTMIMVVAAFAIVSTLVMMIMEKSGDISILKTMGARDEMIERIFAIEGTLIGLVGTALGVIAGVSVTSQIAWVQQQIEAVIGIDTLPASVYQFDTLPAELDFGQIAIAVGIAMVLALGATLLPSRQGARLDPVEALRYE
ncbi:MAG: lipoprotein-releasing ABC transporter permease subunit [Deltaproteobacteria bacterium]|nr:lipoprotein-releasing ABC transporter permease subunit [Deltaproteobacteria bacterium]